MTGTLEPVADRAPGAPVHPRALDPATHLIALYQGEAELTRVAAAFVGAGLAAGDRVLYLASGRPLPSARASLEASNAVAAPAIAAGQLVVRGFSDVYGAPASLEPAAAASGIRAAADLARADGFPGLRVAAEMGGFSRVFGSIEKMLAWERMASRLQHDDGISSVCQYDRDPLYQIAATLPADGCLILARPSPQAQRLIGILGWQHPQLKIEAAGL